MFVCERFAVQILRWSLEFVIQVNLERDTIGISRKLLCFLFKDYLDKAIMKMLIFLKLISVKNEYPLNNFHQDLYFCKNSISKT